MVDNARAVSARSGEGMWLRLVDVPAALRGRAYSAPFEVVIEVADEVCPWNAGRYRVGWDGSRAECDETSATAHLELSVADLGAAYLGGTTLEVLARAGRVGELRDGTLAPVSRSFAGTRAPWCPEIF
jgi:predicted acetyltransferase